MKTIYCIIWLIISMDTTKMWSKETCCRKDISVFDQSLKQSPM
jgi:hypothetical protein